MSRELLLFPEYPALAASTSVITYHVSQQQQQIIRLHGISMSCDNLLFSVRITVTWEKEEMFDPACMPSLGLCHVRARTPSIGSQVRMQEEKKEQSAYHSS